jgi:thiamine-phosphate pyrophosphorylase
MILPKYGVYAITPEHLSGAPLLAAVTSALAGGCTVLQLRAKPPNLHDAQALQALCARFRVPLIINDDVALAKQLHAGVHLGESDQDIRAARAELGNGAIIGASCYDSMLLATRAKELGASYVAFGSFFTSQTKAQPRRATPELLHHAAALGLPRVAIGGIDASNGASIVATGVEFIAVVNGLFAQPDIRSAAQTLSNFFAGRA